MIWSLSVAELVLELGERPPALVRRRRGAATGARVQVLATARAQPAAVVAANQPLGNGEQQLLPHGGPEVDLRPPARRAGGRSPSRPAPGGRNSGPPGRPDPGKTGRRCRPPPAAPRARGNAGTPRPPGSTASRASRIAPPRLTASGLPRAPDRRARPRGPRRGG